MTFDLSRLVREDGTLMIQSNEPLKVGSMVRHLFHREHCAAPRIIAQSVTVLREVDFTEYSAYLKDCGWPLKVYNLPGLSWYVVTTD